MRKKKYIAHVDMDAFFASVEQRDNPEFRDRPVVVGADPKKGKGRGVVSTCSYEARKFGIHSGMPISHAYRLCPKAVFTPVNMKKYARVSSEIYKIFYEFTPQIEPISIDEAFLDISASYRIFGSVPKKTCVLLKSRIKEKTALTASVGLAPIKMAAKIASDLEKPDGLVEVTESNLHDFLRPLDISKIWGLGKKTQNILKNMGIKTIGQLADRDIKELIGAFGKNGAHFWSLANGIDERDVETESETKSISNETTFSEDTKDTEMIACELMRLSEKVSTRLRVENFKARTITLKIRLEDFDTYTRASTLGSATNFDDIIYGEIKKLYTNFKTRGKKVRLVGVKASSLSSSEFCDTLFHESDDEKRKRVSGAVDIIRERFGYDLIKRARSQAAK